MSGGGEILVLSSRQGKSKTGILLIRVSKRINSPLSMQQNDTLIRLDNII